MDTPETLDPRTSVQCFGPEASRHTGALLPAGTPVRLVYDVDRTDRYGRTLAYVYRLSDGLFVNVALVRDGYARTATYPPNVAHVDEIRVAEAEAREAARGLWRGCEAAGSTVTTAPPTPAGSAGEPPRAHL
jgi:micrococcal nuclease